MEINRVLIADDHKLILTGLVSILENHFAINQILAFSEPESVVREAEKQHCNLYILDLEYTNVSGFDLIKDVRKKHPKSLIIVNTMHNEIWTIKHLLSLGVEGVILKNSDCECLVEAIEKVMLGGTYYCPRYASLISIKHKYDERIKNNVPTRLELIVLEHLANGHTSKKIGELLSVTEDAIEAHRRNLFLKLEAKNAAHLVSIGLKHGLISPKDKG